MRREKTASTLKGVSFLLDEKGKKKALVVDIATHKKALEEFLEDLYGHQKIREKKAEPTISKEQFLRGLKDDGLL